MPRKVILSGVGTVNSVIRAADTDSSSFIESDDSRPDVSRGPTERSASSKEALPRKPSLKSRVGVKAGASSKLEAGELSPDMTRINVAPDSQVFIVRTETAKRGGRTVFRVTTSVDGRRGSSSTKAKRLRLQREVASETELVNRVGVEFSKRPKIRLDLTQGWGNLTPDSGARVTPLRNLLDTDTDKCLELDLSNHRPRELRKGAEILKKEFTDQEAWLNAFRDLEIGLLVETFADEISRFSNNPSRMPRLELVCQDQPLFTAVFPLVTSLAEHAASLSRLMRLDLNRYSRSEDVCEAHLPTDEVRIEAYDKFIARLAQLLEDSPSLRVLGLRMNGVDSFALAEIADALVENQVLERLDLSGNPLCTEASEARQSHLGIRVLARALRSGCSLAELDLSFCGLDESAANVLMQAVACNKKLRRINLGGNPIPPGHAIFKDKRIVRIVSIKPGM
jgi:hypothetical protein